MKTVKVVEEVPVPVRSIEVRTVEIPKIIERVSEWDDCISDGGCNGYKPGDEGWGRGRRPVINVSWHDAKAYVAWLSRKTGKAYRILSEAEWEYAARAGSTSRFHYGNSEKRICDYANAADQTTPYEFRNMSCSDGLGEKTADVGTYRPNKFGLHDFHGNVREWVEDCYKESYRGAQSDGSARTTRKCSSRVARGGSWLDKPGFIRSAVREQVRADYKSLTLGFRVARTLTPEELN